MATVREYEAALQRNPADTEAFVALRKTYRQAGKARPAGRAVRDPRPGHRRRHQGGRAVLPRRGAAHRSAGRRRGGGGRSGQRRRSRSRPHPGRRPPQGHLPRAGADRRLHDDAGDGGGRRGAHPRPRAHRRAGSRDGPALPQPLRAPRARGAQPAAHAASWRQEHVRSIESARKIYRALGDYRAVVRLYELELEGTSDARRRADLLLGLGRVLGEKLEELDAAAQRLAEVVRLRPRDEKALELLAAVYANPNWIGADGTERAAAIYYPGRAPAPGGRRHRKRHRLAAQGAGGGPRPRRGRPSCWSGCYYDAERFQELDRYYRERVAGARPREPSGSTSSTSGPSWPKAELDDRAEAHPRLQRDLAARAARWPRLGAAWSSCTSRARTTPSWPSCASGSSAQVADPQPARPPDDGAGHALPRSPRRPGSGRGLPARRPGARSRERRSRSRPTPSTSARRATGARWSTCSSSRTSARASAASPSTTCSRASRRSPSSAEKQLGDAERALAAWQRAEEIAPDLQPRPRGAAPAAAQEQELGSHGRAARARGRPPSPTWGRASRSCAAPPSSTARSWATRARAIEIYREILRVDPHDAVSMRAVVEIYERGGRLRRAWPSCCASRSSGPTSKQERVGLLRRVLVICDERLNDLAQGQWAANEILQAVPGDRDTLDAPRADPRAGRTSRPSWCACSTSTPATPPTPTRRSRSSTASPRFSATTSAIRASAAERLEEVVRLDPDDGTALDTLGEIYTGWSVPATWRGCSTSRSSGWSPTPRAQAEYLRQLARLVEGPLRDLPRARRSWEELLELLPTDEEALEALARIATGAEDWPTLVQILERQIPLAAGPDARGDAGAWSARRSSRRS